MTDKSQAMALVETGAKSPDYELAETLDLDDPAQLRALTDDTRLAILDLILERAATTTELAATLERPKGTIGYHLEVLLGAGLVRVVRRERVRALEARYYGRTARTFVIKSFDKGVVEPDFMLRSAIAEMAAARDRLPDEAHEGAIQTMRYARVATERLAEYRDRLDQLAAEFSAESRVGDVVWSLVLALFPTVRPHLPVR
jgi:DNA-binding transcriptional ArsR family regulator